MHKVRELGLFRDLLQFWAETDGRMLFTEDGGTTPAGRSFFGKLLKRFNRSTFADGGESFCLIRTKAGFTEPRFVIVRSDKIDDENSLS